jgi:hypothetical protein
MADMYARGMQNGAGVVPPFIGQYAQSYTPHYMGPPPQQFYPYEHMEADAYGNAHYSRMDPRMYGAMPPQGYGHFSAGPHGSMMPPQEPSAHAYASDHMFMDSGSMFSMNSGLKLRGGMPEANPASLMPGSARPPSEVRFPVNGAPAREIPRPKPTEAGPQESASVVSLSRASASSGHSHDSLSKRDAQPSPASATGGQRQFVEPAQQAPPKVWKAPASPSSTSSSSSFEEPSLGIPEKIRQATHESVETSAAAVAEAQLPPALNLPARETNGDVGGREDTEALKEDASSLLLLQSARGPIRPQQYKPMNPTSMSMVSEPMSRLSKREDYFPGPTSGNYYAAIPPPLQSLPWQQQQQHQSEMQMPQYQMGYPPMHSMQQAPNGMHGGMPYGTNGSGYTSMYMPSRAGLMMEPSGMDPRYMNMYAPAYNSFPVPDMLDGDYQLSGRKRFREDAGKPKAVRKRRQEDVDYLKKPYKKRSSGKPDAAELALDASQRRRGHPDTGRLSSLPPTSVHRVRALQEQSRDVLLNSANPSEAIRARTSWIGVSYVPRLKKYRSFIFHPVYRKTIGCGTHPTAYDAAKARHKIISSLPMDIRAHISQDFVPDPLDPDVSTIPPSLFEVEPADSGAPSSRPGAAGDDSDELASDEPSEEPAGDEMDEQRHLSIRGMAAVDAASVPGVAHPTPQ